MTTKSEFRSIGVNLSLVKALNAQEIYQPTPIQERSIPLVKSGRDTIGIAQTGTGKTLAFLIPLAMRLISSKSTRPMALILAPTRELAIQIGKETEKLLEFTHLRSFSIYGGVGITHQLKLFNEGTPDILVATPGRFVEIYKKHVIPYRKVRFLILDEADRMMDMGFLPQLRYIQELLPTKKQHLLFSATLPDKVQTFMDEFMDFPERIEITPPATPAKKIKQLVYHTPNKAMKLAITRNLLEKNEQLKRVLLFCRTKKAAEWVLNELSPLFQEKISIIHSNKGQSSRLATIKRFAKGESRVLVATDIAARGLDIPDVSHVISFDTPVEREDYIHRIGRTGRAGKRGIAILFVTAADKYHFRQLQRLMGLRLQVNKIPEGIEESPTPKEEILEMAKELDRQRKRKDPNYQGAFHEKKRKPQREKKNRGRR